MKKFSLALALVSSVLIIGCKKSDDIKPLESTPVANTKATVFDESNSKTVTWEQLPENLKNAAKVEVELNADAKVAAYYKYFVGTWGGPGGASYAIYPAASNDKIYAVAVRSGAYIDALTIWYIRTDGTLYYKSVGGTGGSYYIQYLSRSEYIYAIGGRSGAYIDRLTIYTNAKSFSYGGNGGAPFYVSVPYGDQILGFYGGAGKFVDRIGGYVYSF